VPPGALLVGVALPLVFLHVGHQPGFELALGPLSVGVTLADIAVAVVAIAALAEGLRLRLAPLRAARWSLAASAAFLVFAVAAAVYPIAGSLPYDWQRHLVSAAKFAEYGVLAAAVPLLVRDARGLRTVVVALVAWSGAATLVGSLQFAGVGVAGPWPSGFRQPSFLGPHDFAALSGATLGIAVAALALRAAPVPRAVAAAAALFGGVGCVVAGSVVALAGVAAAAAAALVIARLRGWLRPRPALAVAGIVAVTALGTLAIRAGDLGEFLRFTGVREEREQTTEDVQTYAHHTVLAYIGLRIFLDHPLVGVGWGGSGDEPAYGPQLDDARRKFPRAAAASFPAPEHPWGVQNAYVQALADLGVVGAALLAAALGTAFATAVRTALRAPPAAAFAATVALAWLVVAAAVLAAVGLVAGLPVDGLLWLAVGLGAAAAAWAREAAR
jgi:hypothetical protein